IVDEPAERGESHLALTDVLVAIHAAPERFLRIVHVKHFQAVEADAPLELLEGLAVAARGHDVVSRGEQVTRVEADADAWMSAHAVDDRGDFVEVGAETGTLTGRVLQKDERAPARSTLEQRQ